MNYFELFGIPLSLSIDKKELTSKYFRLQKQYHPDFYGKGTPAEKEEALELSAMINKAYKTFSSVDDTIQYVLQLKGLLKEDEKFQMPPLFLMEVMELNEMKMDGIEPETIQLKAQHLRDEILSDVLPVIEQYHEQENSNGDLLKLKEYYYKKKYLDRLVQG